MTHFTVEDRQRWIGLLSRGSSQEIESYFQSMGASIPRFSELRPPETGMVMVRGRVAGSGAPFNLGEMTVTRCSISALGYTGHALVQGRRLQHAKFAALADALLQDEAWFGIIHNSLIERLQQEEKELAQSHAADADATKVDFFTMVRGEDEK